LIQSSTYILPNISFTGGNQSIKSVCAHNHSGSYASEQSQSHKIALYLLSEHTSAATVLFGFRDLRRIGVEGRTHVLLRLGGPGTSSCTCLGAWYVQKAREMESPSRTFSFSSRSRVRTFSIHAAPDLPGDIQLTRVNVLPVGLGRAAHCHKQNAWRMTA
jgi:hypothetical protein